MQKTSWFRNSAENISNTIVFKVTLKIKRLSDIPNSGKFYCKIRNQQKSFLRYFSSNEDQSTKEVRNKNNICEWDDVFLFDDVQLCIEPPRNELNDYFLRISVRGTSKKTKIDSGEFKFGYVDVNLAEFGTGQPMQKSYLLNAYGAKRVSNATLSVLIRMQRKYGTPRFVPKPCKNIQLLSKTNVKVPVITDDNLTPQNSPRNIAKNSSSNTFTTLSISQSQNNDDAQSVSTVDNQEKNVSKYDDNSYTSVARDLNDNFDTKTNENAMRFCYAPKVILDTRTDADEIVDSIFEEYQHIFDHLQSKKQRGDFSRTSFGSSFE